MHGCIGAFASHPISVDTHTKNSNFNPSSIQCDQREHNVLHCRNVHSGLAAAPIDPKVLAQLPEAMQREVLAGLPSHRAEGLVQLATELPHISDMSAVAHRPENGSGQVRSNSGASTHVPQPAAPATGIAEVKEIWITFHTAFEALAAAPHPRRWHKRQSVPAAANATVSCRPQAIEVDVGMQKAEALIELIIEWGKSLLPDNIEGLQFVLRRLQETGKRWKHWYEQSQGAVDELQAIVKLHFSAPIALSEPQL